MTERRVFDFTIEPPPAVLASLLRASVGIASQFGLMLQHPTVRLEVPGARLLAQLAPYRISTQDVGEWPGSRLRGDWKARRFLHRLEAGAVELLLDASSRLYDWVSPALPEDLHLLRADGSVLMGSITQEQDAWLELDADEHLRLFAAAPGLAKVLGPHRPRWHTPPAMEDPTS